MLVTWYLYLFYLINVTHENIVPHSIPPFIIIISHLKNNLLKIYAPEEIHSYIAGVDKRPFVNREDFFIKFISKLKSCTVNTIFFSNLVNRCFLSPPMFSRFFSHIISHREPCRVPALYRWIGPILEFGNQYSFLCCGFPQVQWGGSTLWCGGGNSQRGHRANKWKFLSGRLAWHCDSLALNTGNNVGGREYKNQQRLSRRTGIDWLAWRIFRKGGWRFSDDLGPVEEEGIGEGTSQDNKSKIAIYLLVSNIPTRYIYIFVLISWCCCVDSGGNRFGKFIW